MAAGRGIKCHVCVEDVVVVAEPHDEENTRNILLEDDSPVGRTRHLLSCFRVELKVLTLSMSLLSTALGTHSLRALHTSLIVGRSFISLDKLLRIVSCTGRGHLRFIPTHGHYLLNLELTGMSVFYTCSFSEDGEVANPKKGLPNIPIISDSQ